MGLFIPIALILVGLLLIWVEVHLVPGMNVVGILGLILIVFAVGYMFTEAGIVGGTLTLLGAASATGSLFWIVWQTGAWDRFILSTSLKRDDQATARESEARNRYLGRIGRAVTPLRPTGVAEFGDERIEVMTEGDFIAAGSHVRVVAMDRRRYFVRLAESEATPVP